MKRTLTVLIAMLFSTTVVSAAPQYVCWDGQIVKNARKCPPYKLPVVCPNGKVVNLPSECPPIIICPDGSLSTTSCPLPPVNSVVVE